MKLFWQIFGPVFECPNTIWGAKKTNTKYQILFGIGIIRIPNTNTTIQNNILIPNYSSHTVFVKDDSCLRCKVALATFKDVLVYISTHIFCITICIGIHHHCFYFFSSFTTVSLYLPWLHLLLFYGSQSCNNILYGVAYFIESICITLACRFILHIWEQPLGFWVFQFVK